LLQFFHQLAFRAATCTQVSVQPMMLQLLARLNAFAGIGSGQANVKSLFESLAGIAFADTTGIV